MENITLELYLSDSAAYIKALRARANELDIQEPTHGELIACAEAMDVEAILRDGKSVGKPGYSLDDYSEDSAFDWDCYFYE